jgi:hypothetical protein
MVLGSPIAYLKVAINVSGIKSRKKIKRGDVRKVIVSARIPYTVEQTQTISDLKYRLYVNEEMLG